MKTLPITMLALFMSIATTAVYGHAATAEQHKHDEAASEEIYKEKSAHMQKMQEHMKTMQAGMQAIHTEKDPEKRKELMQAHRKSMHEGMKMMHGMDGGMMGSKHKSANGQGKEHEHGKGKMSPERRADMMEQHMGMMQQMMEQMMQHDDAKHQHSKK